MSGTSRGRLGDLSSFGRFWIVSTVSDFGTYVTALALQVLIVVTLRGSATEVELVSAARWLPSWRPSCLAGAKPDQVGL